MRAHRIEKLPRIAKYAVLAMLLADGAGVYLAHNRINRAPPSLLAEVESPGLAMAAPGLGIASGGLQASDPDGGVDIAAAPAARPFEALPPMLVFKPIEYALIDEVTPALRVAEAEERRALVPNVRIAAIRPIGKQARLFSSAFARDIDGPARADSSLPDVDFGQVRMAREADQQSSAAYGEGLPEVSLSSAEQVEATAPELPAEPVTALAGNADAPIAPIEAAPAAPSPDAGGEGELPPS